MKEAGTFLCLSLFFRINRVPQVTVPWNGLLLVHSFFV